MHERDGKLEEPRQRHVHTKCRLTITRQYVDMYLLRIGLFPELSFRTRERLKLKTNNSRDNCMNLSLALDESWFFFSDCILSYSFILTKFYSKHSPIGNRAREKWHANELNIDTDCQKRMTANFDTD